MTDDNDTVWRGPDQLRPLLVPVDSLTPDPANANAHPEKNLRTIRGSYALYGQQSPIVVSKAGVISAGNGQWQVVRDHPLPLVKDGDPVQWTHIAAVVSDLTHTELVGFGIVDNRSGELAEWDLDVLASHLGGLHEEGMDLDLMGFDEADIAKLLGEAEPPEGFQEVDENLETEYECPKCGYSWAGSPT